MFAQILCARFAVTKQTFSSNAKWLLLWTFQFILLNAFKITKYIVLVTWLLCTLFRLIVCFKRWNGCTGCVPTFNSRYLEAVGTVEIKSIYQFIELSEAGIHEEFLLFNSTFSNGIIQRFFSSHRLFETNWQWTQCLHYSPCGLNLCYVR